MPRLLLLHASAHIEEQLDVPEHTEALHTEDGFSLCNSSQDSITATPVLRAQGPPDPQLLRRLHDFFVGT